MQSSVKNGKKYGGLRRSSEKLRTLLNTVLFSKICNKKPLSFLGSRVTLYDYFSQAPAIRTT